MNEIMAGLLLFLGVGAGARGMRRLRAGLRDGRSLDVVRGIRGAVVAVVAVVLAAGILLVQSGLIALAMVFLGEELYETGLLAAIIRSGERAEDRERRRLWG